MLRRNFNIVLAATGIAFALTPSAAVASWPNGKTISIVVPYAPGGTADALARLIAQYLGPKLGTNVVVANKAGRASALASAVSLSAGCMNGARSTPSLTPPSPAQWPISLMVARSPHQLHTGATAISSTGTARRRAASLRALLALRSASLSIYLTGSSWHEAALIAP